MRLSARRSAGNTCRRITCRSEPEPEGVPPKTPCADSTPMWKTSALTVSVTTTSLGPRALASAAGSLPPAVPAPYSDGPVTRAATTTTPARSFSSGARRSAGSLISSSSSCADPAAGGDHQAPALHGPALQRHQDQQVDGEADDADDEVPGEDHVGADELGAAEDHGAEPCGRPDDLGGDQRPPGEAEPRPQPRHHVRQGAGEDHLRDHVTPPAAEGAHRLVQHRRDRADAEDGVGEDDEEDG